MQSGDSFFSGFRQWYSMKPVALRTLISINVVLYVLWQLLFRNITISEYFFFRYLTLHPELPGILFQPWQILTYAFLHLGIGFGGLIHILFNMLWLYWLGRDYEELYGPPRMLAVYLITAMSGGVMTVLLHAIFPGVPNFGGPVYGASAASIGVLCMAATLNPNKGLGLLFLGVIPLKYLAVGFLAIDLLIGIGGQTSLSAHWGGALAGFLLARAQQNGIDVTSWGSIFFRGHAGRTARRAPYHSQPEGGMATRFQKWFSSKRTDKDMFGPAGPRRPRVDVDRAPVAGDEQEEVDRILDKISEEGYESLTDEEKRILFEASKK